jgi:DNA-binding transcriptional ArsR family regulator
MIQMKKAHDLMNYAVTAGTLASLAQVGVLDAICEGPCRVGELRERFGLDEPALVRALGVLKEAGYLEEEGGAWQVEAELREAGERGPANARQVLFLMNGLTEHLKSGASLMSDDDMRGMTYQVATPGLARMWAEPAAELASRFAPAKRILDVGAGAGPWSLAMAARYDDVEVTALDLPPVLPRFEEAAKAAGARYQLAPGSFFEVELEPVYDRVILGNVLHLERPDGARRLLERARGWVAPGGELVIVDAFPFEGHELDLAIYRLHLALRVSGGTVHDEETLRAWCRGVGLEPEAVVSLGRVGALRARAP